MGIRKLLVCYRSKLLCKIRWALLSGPDSPALPPVSGTSWYIPHLFCPSNTHPVFHAVSFSQIRADCYLCYGKNFFAKNSSEMKCIPQQLYKSRHAEFPVLSSMYENQDSSLNKNWELQFSFKTETWGLIPFQTNVRMRFIKGGKRIKLPLVMRRICKISKIVFLFSTWRMSSLLPSVVKTSKPQV